MSRSANPDPVPDPVVAWLNRVDDANPMLGGLAREARRRILEITPDGEECIKYGGILFGAPVLFCGLFAHTSHVTLEFGRGCDLSDPHGSLEGTGKFRRHIKLTTIADLDRKRVGDYVAQALANARKPAA